MSEPVVVAEVVRSGFVEGHHRGSVVALDAAGEVAWSVGDATDAVLPRSCNKPLQALGMVRLGLVTRARSETSNREVVVELSAKGRAQVESLIPIAKGLESIASSGLSAKEQAVVKRALKRMYQNLTNGRRKSR